MPPSYSPDTLLPLRLAVKLVPRSSRTGRCLHYSALYRWASRGLLAADGTRVFLEAKKAGSCLCTTPVAIEAFLEATAADTGTQTAIAKRPSNDTARRRRHRRPDEVARALDEAGF